MNTIDVIDGAPAEGEEILQRLYECDSSGPTREAAMSAMAERAQRIYEQWAARPDAQSDGTRVALHNVSSGRTPGGGRHACWLGAEIVVVGPARGRVVPCDEDEQRALSGYQAPTADHHRRVLRRALALHSQGRPVRLDDVLPSMLALLVNE